MNYDRINQAAFIASDSGERLASLINTDGVRSSPGAQRVHGIKQSDVDAAPSFACAPHLRLACLLPHLPCPAHSPCGRRRRCSVYSDEI